VDQDQEFWFGRIQREKIEEREERRERKWRREKRRERRQILVCVTKPKILVLVHTRFSLTSVVPKKHFHMHGETQPYPPTTPRLKIS
jgi:hypothetical protein